MILVSDIPGLLRNPEDEGSLIPRATLSEIEELKKDGVISGGMIPKVDCLVTAVQGSVPVSYTHLDIKKVVLAYSGGLDTSIIIPWLKEHYNNCEVVAVSADVGQGTELDGLEEKAIKTGASKLYILDLKDEFVEDYIYPCLKANAVYEDCLLYTSRCV